MIELRGDPRTRRRTLLAIGVVLALASACGTSGRNMTAPAPGATAPPRRPDPTTSTVVGQNTVITSDLFTLTSAAFEPGGQIPAEYTCENVGNAPPFSWAHVPPGTAELALVITDPDAGGYVHWFITKIDPTTAGLGPRFAPQGSVEVTNSAGTTAYAPICPPKGELHQYEFTLYALDKPSGLTADADPTAAITMLATSAIGTAVLTGDYTR